MLQRTAIKLIDAPTPTPLSVGVAAAALLASYVVYNLYLHPLASLPGPFISRSGLFSFLLLRALKKDYIPATKALLERYPDARHIRQVYGLKTRFTKTDFYGFMRPGDDESIFSATDAKQHALLRPQCAAGYAMKTLLELEECALRFFAFDVVTDLAFGQPLGLTRQRRDVLGVVDTLFVGFNRAVALALHPRLGRAVLGVLKLFTDPTAKLVGWSVDCIQGRLRRGDTSRRDMLSTFMRSRDPTTGRPLDLGQLLVAAFPVLTAGGDTTSATMAAFVALTHERPEVLQRLRDEVDGCGLSMPPTGSGSGSGNGNGNGALFLPEGTEVTMSSWHYPPQHGSLRAGRQGI
ncbi:uncharacterized protein PSFLO_05910 [Pseudozyma flocculosa]|uniref:Cytochrome P450 n=1 Tax=Pseudozyma flocculosa TaxID=84751 RepID=A0A5C3F7H5_9BASI|nr:uncharacterized protein PSFLO_05910 [Pseudozyma flocculosa]